MIPVTGCTAHAIYNASMGRITSDDIDDAVAEMTDAETEEFFKLIKVLTILHDGEYLMNVPANLYPV